MASGTGEPLIRNMGHNTRRPAVLMNPGRAEAGNQLATGQPGVGAGSPVRPRSVLSSALCAISFADPLPLGRAPALGGGHEVRVLAQEQERGQPLESEAVTSARGRGRTT